MVLSLVGTLLNDVKSCNLFGESLHSIPPKNIIDNHSRLSRDLRKHTRNGHLGKVPGGFESGTPGSPIQHSDPDPDPDPNSRRGGQLPNPNSAILP